MPEKVRTPELTKPMVDVLDAATLPNAVVIATRVTTTYPWRWQFKIEYGPVDYRSVVSKITETAIRACAERGFLTHVTVPVQGTDRYELKITDKGEAAYRRHTAWEVQRKQQQEKARRERGR